MAKTFDQTYAETGRQSELDSLRASGQYNQAKATWEASQGALPTTPTAPTAPAGFSTANIARSPTAGFAPSKTFDQFLAESGRQSELDAIRAIPGQYEVEKARYESGGYATAGAADSFTGVTTPTQQELNLPELYKGLQESSGISAIEADLSEKEKQFTEAKGVINDNPWLSEATRVGRVAKLEQLFAERTANLRGDIATKKADIETQLNLQMRQFDINSQQSQIAWQQFSTLLSAGALDNASGEAIANITRSTGISSSMIRSAIAERNKPEPVQTAIIQSEDDAGVVTISVINSQTGAVISQQNLGAIGTKTKVTGVRGGAVSATKNLNQIFTADAETIQGMSTDAGWVGIFPQLVAKYAELGMSLDDMYKLYLNSTVGRQYGAPGESKADIQEIYDTYKGS